MGQWSTRTGFVGAEQGAVLPFVAIASPLFILSLALVVDLGLARLTDNKLQVTADAAAHLGNSMANPTTSGIRFACTAT